MEAVDRVGNKRSRATPGAVAEDPRPPGGKGQRRRHEAARKPGAAARRPVQLTRRQPYDAAHGASARASAGRKAGSGKRDDASPRPCRIFPAGPPTQALCREGMGQTAGGVGAVIRGNGVYSSYTRARSPCPWHTRTSCRGSNSNEGHSELLGKPDVLVLAQLVLFNRVNIGVVEKDRVIGTGSEHRLYHLAGTGGRSKSAAIPCCSRWARAMGRT